MFYSFRQNRPQNHKVCGTRKHRFLSCAFLALYFCAAVVLPVYHGHGTDCCSHGYQHEQGHQHEQSSGCGVPIVPNAAIIADDSCPVCEFAQLTTPLFTFPLPLGLPEKMPAELVIADSVPVTAEVPLTHPSRAPPVLG